MGKNTLIEWTHHTFNGWEGCQKVGPGCDHCYAETRDARFGGGHWGPHAARRRTGARNWNQPRKWDREAAALGERHRVFCSSLSSDYNPLAVLNDMRETMIDMNQSKNKRRSKKS